PLPDLGKRRADPRRHVGFSRLVPRLNGNDRRDGLLGVTRATKRQQAEGTVLLDGPFFVRSVRRLAQLVENHQGVFIRGRGVQITGRGERVVGGGWGERGENEKEKPRRPR